MKEQLERLRHRIEDVKSAPTWLKLQRAEKALDDALTLLDTIVKRLEEE